MWINKFQKISVSFLIFALFFGNIALAVNSSSSNYQIQGGQVSSPFGSSSSTNYQIEVGGNPISGTPSSTNYQTQIGSPLEGVSATPSATPTPEVSVTPGTGGFPTPIASNIQVRNISPTQVEITFETNTRTYARIDYGVYQLFNFQKTEQLEDRETFHTVILTGLTPGTLYNYKLHLWITNERTNDMGPYSFLTSPVITAVPNVSNVEIIPTGEDIIINWQNPIIDNYFQTIIVRKTGSFPKDRTDGTPIYIGEGESYTDTSRSPDTEYFYTIFVETTGGKFSSGVTQTTKLDDGRPTQPPSLPPEVVPTEETGIGEDIVNIFTLLKQNIVMNLGENPIMTVRPVNLINPKGIGWRFLADSDVLIKIPNSIFLKKVERVAISIEDQVYILKYNKENDSHETIFKAPKEDGNYQAILQIVYTDNTFEELEKTVLVDKYGKVYKRERRRWSWKKPWQILFTDRVIIEEASVALETLDKDNEWTTWSANKFNQHNPIFTDEKGEFAFVVPRGEYRLSVEEEGLRAFNGRAFEIENQLVNKDVRLYKKLSTASVIISLFIGIIILGIFYRRRKKSHKR